MNKELYLFRCLDCNKDFRTDNPKSKVCPSCQKLRKPHEVKSKRRKKKILTFAEISHIVKVYDKVNHKYLHYGEVVNLIEANAEHCVCCGATEPEGRQICPQCEKAGE
jgi:hypothetical protein